MTMPAGRRRGPAWALGLGAPGLLCLVAAVLVAVNPLNLVYDGTLFVVAAVGLAFLCAVAPGPVFAWPRWARITTRIAAAVLVAALLTAAALVYLLGDIQPSVVHRAGPNADGVSAVVLATAPFPAIDPVPEVRLRRGHGVLSQESVVYTGPEDSSAPQVRFTGRNRVEVRVSDTCTIRSTYDAGTLAVHEPEVFDLTDIERC